MSLINKMLQDLDARGGASVRTATTEVRPVAPVRQPRTAIAAGAGIGVLLAVAGAVGWHYLWPAVPVASATKPAAPVVAVVPPIVIAQPVAIIPPPVATSAVPQPVLVPTPVVAAVAPSASGSPTSFHPTAEAGVREECGPACPHRYAGEELRSTKPLLRPAGSDPGITPMDQMIEARRQARQKITAGLPLSAASAPVQPGERAFESRQQLTHPPAERPAYLRASELARIRQTAPQPPAQQGITVTSQQQAENSYRRALASLQEGHVQEALASFEQAVYAYPRHEAARQTLIGLLLENGRACEAMRHLQLALGLNANQPQLAMLLARLQLERGGPAIETLQRTLPHAAGNADYIAFLAGVLQKQNRHHEAAEQYEAALRLQPSKGVWWMGLGLSLQADKQTAAARDAYRKAQAAGLTPELQQFVERKLTQLQ